MLASVDGSSPRFDRLANDDDEPLDASFVSLPQCDSTTREGMETKPSHTHGELPLYMNRPTEDAAMLGNASRWSRHLVGWKILAFGSWFNVLLLMIPAAWATKLIFGESHTLVFSLCILSLIPLVRLHDISIAELALRVGGSKTGLLNASMSNLIELVVAISALRKCELRVVQSSLVGSILSKLLLALGLCFFAGGMRFSEQGFDQTATQIHSSLLIISVGVLLLPAAYHFTLSLGGEDAELQKRDILRMSHGVSVVLVLVYAAYLAFQLWSHTHLYGDHHNNKSTRLPATKHISAEKAAAYLGAKSRATFKNFRASEYKSASSTSVSAAAYSHLGRHPPPSLAPRLLPHRSLSTSAIDEPSAFHRYSAGTVRLVGYPNTSQVTSSPQLVDTPDSPVTSSSYNHSSLSVADEATSEDPEKAPIGSPVRPIDSKEPQLSWFLTIVLLLLVTLAVAITADWLVESMDGISTRVSKEWVGLILLPGISSVAECITAMKVSVRDELSLSVSVAVGSTIQTALFVIPFMVLLAWVVNKPLTLLMDPFQSLVLYISVQTTSYVISDGKSNWLEGVILVSLYIIIAIAFWFYPGSIPLDYLVACPVN